MASSKWGKLSSYTGQVFYCYKPHHIASSKGTYHFTVRKKDLKLVSDMLNSNKNWKSRYFFVKGMDWVCRQEEWVTMPRSYFNNTRAFVRDSGQSCQPLFFLFHCNASNTIYSPWFQLVPVSFMSFVSGHLTVLLTLRPRSLDEYVIYRPVSFIASSILCI